MKTSSCGAERGQPTQITTSPGRPPPVSRSPARVPITVTPTPVAGEGTFSSVLPVTASGRMPTSEATARKVSMKTVASAMSWQRVLINATGRAPEHSTSSSGTRAAKCATTSAGTRTRSAGRGPMPPTESQAITRGGEPSTIRRSRTGRTGSITMCWSP